MSDEKFKAKVIINFIAYGGENIGNDWSFKFTVGRKIINWDVQIGHGGNWSGEKVLYEKFIENDVALPIMVDITENDPRYDDKGLGMITLNLLHGWVDMFASPGNPIRDWQTLRAVVVGDPKGDHGKTALLTFSLYSTVGHCEKNDEQITANVEKPDSEKFVRKFQVPALTPPDNVGLIIKEMLDSVGDPGGISGKVDKFLKLTSIHAAGAYDEYEIYTVEICDEVHKCKNGYLEFSGYRNCKKAVRRRKIGELELPDKKVEDVVKENLNEVFDALKDAMK